MLHNCIRCQRDYKCNTPKCEGSSCKCRDCLRREAVSERLSSPRRRCYPCSLHDGRDEVDYVIRTFGGEHGVSFRMFDWDCAKQPAEIATHGAVRIERRYDAKGNVASLSCPYDDWSYSWSVDGLSGVMAVSKAIKHCTDAHRVGVESVTDEGNGWLAFNVN